MWVHQTHLPRTLRRYFFARMEGVSTKTSLLMSLTILLPSDQWKPSLSASDSSPVRGRAENDFPSEKDMPTEDLWKKFQSIRDKLKSDRKFAEAFDKNPGRALRGAGLDAKVPATANSREVNLSNLLGKMSEIERRATIDAVLGGQPVGPGRVAAVTPIANANAGANANA